MKMFAMQQQKRTSASVPKDQSFINNSQGSSQRDFVLHYTVCKTPFHSFITDSTLVVDSVQAPT